MTVTDDLSRFGTRELEMHEELIRAVRNQGLPDGFSGGGMKVMFNTYSGNVFLTNDDLQVAMMNDDGELANWYTLFDCGAEGFFEDLVDEFDDLCVADKLALLDIADDIGEVIQFETADNEAVGNGDIVFIYNPYDNSITEETIIDNGILRDIVNGIEEETNVFATSSGAVIRALEYLDIDYEYDEDDDTISVKGKVYDADDYEKLLSDVS